jgi:hypothetical protein
MNSFLGLRAHKSNEGWIPSLWREAPLHSIRKKLPDSQVFGSYRCPCALADDDAPRGQEKVGVWYVATHDTQQGDVLIGFPVPEPGTI